MHQDRFKCMLFLWPNKLAIQTPIFLSTKPQRKVSPNVFSAPKSTCHPSNQVLGPNDENLVLGNRLRFPLIEVCVVLMEMQIFRENNFYLMCDTFVGRGEGKGSIGNEVGSWCINTDSKRTSARPSWLNTVTMHLGHWHLWHCLRFRAWKYCVVLRVDHTHLLVVFQTKKETI